MSGSTYNSTVNFGEYLWLKSDFLFDERKLCIIIDTPQFLLPILIGIFHLGEAFL